MTDAEGTVIPLKIGNTFYEVLPSQDSGHYIEISVEP